jgi:hypothetical protein
MSVSLFVELKRKTQQLLVVESSTDLITITIMFLKHHSYF